MAKKEDINEGGINGLGQGILNTNSKEFLILQQKIQEAAKQRDPISRIEDVLLGIRFRMQTYLRNREETFTISAGQFLKECLQALNITNKAFATYISFKESNLSSVCKGKRKITPELALKLSKIFHIAPELWLAVQNKEELAQIKTTKAKNHQEMNLKDLLRKSA